MKRSQFIDRVSESNRQAADAWVRWASHRSHVMSVLGQLPPDMRRLCILGAGHLHDVVLSELAEQYSEIILVDIDERTVTAALTRTEERTRERCRVMPAMDLTGVLEMLEGVQMGSVDADQVISALASHETNLSANPFDVTVSLGVLTQLLQAVVDARFAPDEAPRVSVALRDKHLRDLVKLTRPGGRFVLITDIVSSTTAPQLLHTTETNLESEMARLVAAHNFFTGTNPYRIVAMLEDDPGFRNDVCDVRLFDPWLWAVTSDRHHLTCAVLATRRSR